MSPRAKSPGPCSYNLRQLRALTALSARGREPRSELDSWLPSIGGKRLPTPVRLAAYSPGSQI
jgi:hypothetical protein